MVSVFPTSRKLFFLSPFRTVLSAIHVQVTDQPPPDAPSLTQAIIMQMVYCNGARFLLHPPPLPLSLTSSLHLSLNLPLPHLSLDHMLSSKPRRAQCISLSLSLSLSLSSLPPQFPLASPPLSLSLDCVVQRTPSSLTISQIQFNDPSQSSLIFCSYMMTHALSYSFRHLTAQTFLISCQLSHLILQVTWRKAKQPFFVVISNLDRPLRLLLIIIVITPEEYKHV